VTKEELQKLLNKYGFQSLKKEPFLYVKGEEKGFLYSYKDSYYGTLTRIYLPKSKEKAEEFLGSFSWYKKNGLKNQIEIVLDNYETPNPIITYQREGKIFTLEELKKIEPISKKTKNIENEKEQNFIKKLKRTIYILLEIIEEKVNIQNVTYQNLVNLTNEYIEKQNELRDWIDNYKKSSSRRLSKIEIEKNKQDFKSDLDNLKKEMKHLNEKSALEETIFSLVEYLKALEIEEGLLKNKYELIKLPLQIEITKEKIKQMKEMGEKKKKVFGRKENLEEILKQIEEKSNLKKIVSFDHFKENERKRLEEKYIIINDLDIRTIGDYLQEFDNIKIEEPVIEEDKVEVLKELSYEEIMNTLEKNFSVRPKKEQDLLTEISFLLKNVWDEKEKNFEKNIDEFIVRLKNPNNIMMKIKYFKNIDLSTKEKCKETIEKEIEKLKNFKEEELLGECNVFLKGPKELETLKFIKVSPKRLLAPVEKESKINYICHLKKGVPILFLPQEITFDLEDNLILERQKPYFFIDLEKNVLQKKNSDIIKVSEYKEKLIEEENITVAKDLKKQKENHYQKIMIERKEP